ncbi:MAG: hypothetical protein R2734_19650 [Nocardioides sp.]
MSNDGIIPVLAMAVRGVENAVKRGQVTSGQHARFQAVALLAREERHRVKEDRSLTDPQRDTPSSSGSTGSPRSWRRPQRTSHRCSPCSGRTPRSARAPAT